MKYMVHKIEHNYNQIWHVIKANKYIVINYNFTRGILGKTSNAEETGKSRIGFLGMSMRVHT